MKHTKQNVLIVALVLLATLLAAGLAYLAVAWADPDGCVNVFGTYQNCHAHGVP